VNVAHINLGDLARDQGDWVRAQSLYADALAQLRLVGDAWGIALALYSLGLVQSHLRDDEQALKLYTESLRHYAAVGFLVGIGMLDVLEALCEIYARRGDVTRAARGLMVAAARRASIGAPIPPTERTRYDETMAAVRAILGEPAFATIQADTRALSVEHVVTEALSVARPPTAPVVAPEPALNIYALGASRVLVGEHVVQPTEWKYTKAKELFFYLLCHASVTKAQIGLELWPDASPEQLRNYFHRAMHYVRKALGHAEWIRFEDETYTFDPQTNYWCDLREFEASVKEAQRVCRAGLAQAETRVRAIQCLEAAVKLWQGDFLDDLDAGEWAILKRESLHQTFLQALLDLGALYLAEARYADAVAIYQRALSLDNYLEIAHRELMRAYARQGDAARAARHFEELRRLMRAEFGAEPAAETRLLYERLKRGDDV
jgi:two-component SAPR family response regulator